MHAVASSLSFISCGHRDLYELIEKHAINPNDNNIINADSFKLTAFFGGFTQQQILFYFNFPRNFNLLLKTWESWKLTILYIWEFYFVCYNNKIANEHNVYTGYNKNKYEGC